LLKKSTGCDIYLTEMKPRKLLNKILFSIFTPPIVGALIKLQDVNGEAKPYPVKQFLELVEKYGLTLEERQ